MPTNEENQEAKQILDAIHAALNRRVWCADTCQHIAELLESAGYSVNEPE